MKTIMRIVLPSLAILAIASGCSKENDMSNNEAINQKVTIFASIPDEGMETKVTPSQDAIKTAVKLAWENTDYIYINSEQFSVVSISADGKTAEFSGNDPGSGPYNISYSKDFSSVVDQTQTQDGTLDHLKYAAAISGADSYENLSFSSAWATAHGATFTSSSVLELRAKLPASIASSVKKVIFTFPENITVDNKRITVSLTTPGVQSGDNILDVYVTLPDGNINLPNILVQFQVGDNAYEKYSAYREFAPTNALTGGTTQYLGIDCSNIESYANANNANIGQSTNPYLIGDQNQMDYLHTALTSGTSYIKMVDDVDLTDITWVSLNNSGSYDNAVNFNGNAKIVRYLNAPLFDDLNGLIQNLTIDHATVNGGNNETGILANTIKTVASTITNVDITNSSVSANAYVGGLISDITKGPSTISDVDVENTNVSGTLTGGVIGFVQAATNITNCHFVGNGTLSTPATYGVVNASASYSGGLLAATKASSAAIIDGCSVKKAKITSVSSREGGLVGCLRSGSTIQNNCQVGEDGNFVRITNSGESSCSWVGGLIGLCEGGTVEDACAYAEVTAPGDNNNQIGGFIGKISAGTIRRCISYSTVEAGGVDIGGFVGWSDGAVGYTACEYRGTKVWATNSSASDVNLGGFCGNFANAFTATVTRCKVVGVTDSIKSTNDKGRVGGFAGNIGKNDNVNTGSVSQCMVDMTPVIGGVYTGGFAGVTYSAISECAVTGGSSTTVESKSDGKSGAFVGYVKFNDVANSYTNVSFTATNLNKIGGFVGYVTGTGSQKGSVTNCYTTVTLSWGGGGTKDEKNAFVGYCDGDNAGDITKCIAWTNVSNRFGGGTHVKNCEYKGTTTYGNVTAAAKGLAWSETIWSWKNKDNQDVTQPLLKWMLQ